MIRPWKLVLKEMVQTNPSYKDHREYVVQLEKYLTHMLGELKGKFCSKGHHSEYLYRKIR